MHEATGRQRRRSEIRELNSREAKKEKACDWKPSVMQRPSKGRVIRRAATRAMGNRHRKSDEDNRVEKHGRFNTRKVDKQQRMTEGSLLSKRELMKKI